MAGALRAARARLFRSGEGGDKLAAPDAQASPGLGRPAAKQEATGGGTANVT
jgi:hypothetical protein